MQNLKNLYSDPQNAVKLKKAENKTKDILIYIFRLFILLSIGYIILYPLFYMIVTSIKAPAAFLNSARVWLPTAFNIKWNFEMAFDAMVFTEGIKSTLVYEIIAGLLEIVTCAVVAYGFARFKFKFKGVLMACLFITILIPEMMIIIPRMITYSDVDFLGILALVEKITGANIRINLVDTPWAFWLPSLFAMGLRSGILIFIYIQFFKGLPYELEEAAWVDGAGPIRTFISIAVPSSSVVFTTVTVFSIIWHWNDSLLGSMYLLEGFPLAVTVGRMGTVLTSMGYYTFQNPEASAILMAGCLIFITPPLVMYLFLQRKFIESIDRVGITG